MQEQLLEVPVLGARSQWQLSAVSVTSVLPWMLSKREEEVGFHLPLPASTQTLSLSEPTGFATVHCRCSTMTRHNVARPVGPHTSVYTLTARSLSPAALKGLARPDLTHRHSGVCWHVWYIFFWAGGGQEGWFIIMSYLRSANEFLHCSPLGMKKVIHRLPAPWLCECFVKYFN